MANLSKKELKEKRKKDAARAGYIGIAVALFIIGLIGVIIWAVNFSPNVVVYRVGDHEIKKDFYACVYYYQVLTSQNWGEKGYSHAVNPYDQPLNIENNDEIDTWGAYFEQQTNSNIDFLVIMNDLAEKSDYQFSDEVQEKIDWEFNSVLADKGTALDFDIYMLKTFGAQISKKTFQEYLRMYYQATYFYKDISESKALFNEYVGGDNSVFEEAYRKVADQYDEVDFRFYYLEDTAENADKIAALQQAKSEAAFRKLCDTYENDSDYSKNDKSLYQGVALSTISKVANSSIAEKLSSAQAKAGDIYSEKGTVDDKQAVQIVYVVSPRAKNTAAYNDSDVAQWEFCAMNEILKEYYDAHYPRAIDEKGIEVFRKSAEK